MLDFNRLRGLMHTLMGFIVLKKAANVFVLPMYYGSVFNVVVETDEKGIR